MENKTLPSLATSDPEVQIPAGGGFPGMPGTVHRRGSVPARCARAGDGAGASPGGSRGGRAAADTEPTQPRRPRALEAAAWQSLRSLPRRRGSSAAFSPRGRGTGRDVRRALGRTGLAVLVAAVAGSAPAPAPRASPSSSLPAAEMGWPGRVTLGYSPSTVPEGLAGFPGIEG